MTLTSSKIRTRDRLSPLQILAEVKAIEAKMGRQKTVDKGPRNIDLDILLHEDQSWDSPELCVPHKLMLEREFVLRPLCEYAHPYPPPVPIPNDEQPDSQRPPPKRP